MKATLVTRLTRLLAAAGLAVAGYSTFISGALAASGGAHASAPLLLRNEGRLGVVLTNRRGLTLYYFKKDTTQHPTCLNSCTQTWHPFFLSRSMRLSNLHLRGAVGTAIGSGGGHQITYNGWPLYTFAGDRRPGDTRGEGAFGLWYVATPNLRAAPRPVVVAPPPPTPVPAPPPSCIPGMGGGDHDGDNDGAPSDGDGCQ